MTRRNVSDVTTRRRSNRRVTDETNRLVTTAKIPEIEIAWPIWPSVTPRSAAIGDSRLTGMNSDAIRTATQSAMDNTAPQAAVAGAFPHSASGPEAFARIRA